MGSHSHSHSFPTPRLPEKWFDPFSGKPTDLGVLCLRLRMHDQVFDHSLLRGGSELVPVGLDYLDVHRVSDSRVLVMVVAKGQQVTLEDDDLFPSDRLITQLRLLMQEKTP